MRYRDLKKRQQEEFNRLPIMWAFNSRQFNEGLEKLGAAESEITYIGHGGYMKKEKLVELQDLLEKHAKENIEAFNDDQYAYEAFQYELGNHEYCITYEAEPALSALGLTEEMVHNDCRLNEIFKQAKKDYLTACERY